MSELISGADALRALADGKKVEANNSDFGYWIDATNLSVNDFFDDIHIFRLKPRIVKLEIEVPESFVPKVGDSVYFIDYKEKSGWSWITSHEHLYTSWYQFGAYRTEEDVKKVVEQLRKLGVTK